MKSFRAISAIVIGLFVIGTAVLYFSMPEKAPPDPRFSVSFLRERLEWSPGSQLMVMQNVASVQSSNYKSAVLQRKFSTVNAAGDRLTVFIYIHLRQEFTVRTYQKEIIEYQLLCVYPDRSETEYVNATILTDETGTDVFNDIGILGKVNFKVLVDRDFGYDADGFALPVTTLQVMFMPEPEEAWNVRWYWDYQWNPDTIDELQLLSYDQDGNATVPIHFRKDIFNL